MKKKMLTLSSLFIIGLSGCMSTPSVRNYSDSLAQAGEEDINTITMEEENKEYEKIDWLTAWWKKSVPDTAYPGIKGLGFSRWLTAIPQEEGLEAEDNVVNLWDTIGDQVTLADPDHPRIRKEALFYARNSRFLDRISERAEPYINFVWGEVQRRNMPVEVALLPAVESAYEPRATSPRRAAGLWQLIPGTARRWGVVLNRHYDGRRDVFASTHAALNYLQKLNDDFDGDWLLTMAAYNCGEFNVARAIRRNLARGKPTDFWSLDLPRETRTFVPRILGLAALIAEPENYGIQLKTLRDRPIVPVKVGYQVDLTQVAKLADVPLQEVKRLNPAYHRGGTDAEEVNLLLPAPQARTFEERLAAMDPEKFFPFSTASDAPPVESITAKRVTHSHSTSSPRKHSSVQIHVVRPGDTLGKVARTAGVKVKDIMLWNHLKPRTILHPGQRLTLRLGATEVSNLPKAVRAHAYKQANDRVKTVIFAREKRRVGSGSNPQESVHLDSKVTQNKHIFRTYKKRS